jgi:type IV fimbrial biogenesis protein FimT
MRTKSHFQHPRVVLGFTLVELLVTLTIVAILLAVGAPSLTQMVQRQAVASAMQALASDLRFARSEALKRGTQVELCGSSITTTTSGTGSTATSTTTYSCLAAPIGNGRADWVSNGWLIRDTTNNSIIKVQQKAFGVGALTSTDSTFVFNPTGILSGSAGGNVLITPTNTSQTSDQQIACIGKTGRLRIVKGSTTCS